MAEQTATKGHVKVNVFSATVPSRNISFQVKIAGERLIWFLTEEEMDTFVVLRFVKMQAKQKKALHSTSDSQLGN